MPHPMVNAFAMVSEVPENVFCEEKVCNKPLKTRFSRQRTFSDSAATKFPTLNSFTLIKKQSTSERPSMRRDLQMLKRYQERGGIMHSLPEKSFED